MYSSNHHLKGVASEGFNKSSSSFFEPASQALCKVCMPESNLCVALFVRPSKERHQQGFGLFAQTFFSRALQRFVCLNPICSLLCLCDPLREGISKAHFPLFKPHLKGSARLKASLSVVNTSSQGLCKASARLHYPYSNLLLKGPARFV